MHTTTLRKVGGSVMLAVPPALLDLLKLGVGAKVDIGVENGRLIVEQKVRPPTHSRSFWRSATRTIRLPMRIVPGLMPTRSAKSCCSEARRHLARHPRSYGRP